VKPVCLQLINKKKELERTVVERAINDPKSLATDSISEPLDSSVGKDVMFLNVEFEMLNWELTTS